MCGVQLHNLTVPFCVCYCNNNAHGVGRIGWCGCYAYDYYYLKKSLYYY